MPNVSIYKKKSHKAENKGSQMIKFCASCLKVVAICHLHCEQGIRRRRKVLLWSYRHWNGHDARIIYFQEKVK